MPSGRFTKRHIPVICSVCNKEKILTEGEYNWRIKRNFHGKIYCSVPCKNKGIATDDVRETRLLCTTCDIDFTENLNKYDYRKRLKRLNKNIRIFCSDKCAKDTMNRDPEHIKKVADTQRGISVPSRTVNRIGTNYSKKTRLRISISKTGMPSGRKGYIMKEGIKEKIRLTKIGKPATKTNWNIVHEEMKHRGISNYAITNAPIPDAVWVEDGKLVALELENKRVFFEVNRKMQQYIESNLCYHAYDKVYIVWSLPDGTSR